MRIPLSILVIVTFGCTLETGFAAEDDHWRVVVQDVRPDHVQAVSTDGNLIAASSRRTSHVLHVVALKRATTVLTHYMPSRIIAAAFDPSSKWLVVSTDRTIYRIDLASAAAKMIAPGAAGHVAISRDGKRMAVLGSLEDEEGGIPIGIGRAARLGIYDFENDKWLAKCETPILIDHTVAFDGPTAIAYGRGGRVFHRLASSFECDVKLGPTAEAPLLARGPTIEGRRTVSEEELGDYRRPEAIVAVQDAIQTARKRLVELHSRLSPSERPAAATPVLAFRTEDKQVTAVVDRSHIIPALLTIKRDGTIACRTVDLDVIHHTYLSGDRFLAVKAKVGDDAAVNLSTGEELFPLPERQGNRGWFRFLSNGCLTRSENLLSFYSNDSKEPRWTFELDREEANLYPVVASPDGRYIALGFGDDADEIVLILSAQTGKVVARIPRPDDDGNTGYCFSAAFSEDGSRLAYLFRKSFRIYSVMGGQLMYDEKYADDQYVWSVTAFDDQWLLGATNGSIFYREGKGFGPTIPIDEAYRATAIEALGKPAVLLETRDGLGAIVERESGGSLTTWVTGEYQGSSGAPEMPPRAVVAFNGRLLIRSTAACSFELLSLRTLEHVATIHYLPVDRQMQWILYTPDGYWDASQKAEEFAVVLHGSERATDEEIETRRQAALIRERIARISAEE